jgi:hypothetical protein
MTTDSIYDSAVSDCDKALRFPGREIRKLVDIYSLNMKEVGSKVKRGKDDEARQWRAA